MQETRDRADSWFALQVKPRHEKRAALALEVKGFQQFLPLYRSRRKWSDRYKAVEMPLFPGYVFSRFDPRVRAPILTIPGVLYIVGLGKIPLPVDDSEIAALRAIVISGLPARPWPFLKVGQLVRMEDGPLTGLTGILQDFKGSHRLVVSVTLLQRAVAVEVESDWVSPFGLPAPRPVAAASAPTSVDSDSEQRLGRGSRRLLFQT